MKKVFEIGYLIFDLDSWPPMHSIANGWPLKGVSLVWFHRTILKLIKIIQECMHIFFCSDHDFNAVDRYLRNYFCFLVHISHQGLLVKLFQNSPIYLSLLQFKNNFGLKISLKFKLKVQNHHITVSYKYLSRCYIYYYL